MARVKSPQPNQISKGAVKFKFALIDAKDMWLFGGAGAPVNGTNGDGASWAGKGSIYIDETTPGMYQNTGTKASPVWTIFEAAGVSPTFASITLTGLLFESSADNITAFAGGGQASATPLTKEVNRITTVATAGDSVMLPASAPGLTIILANAAAKPMQVFGAGTDTIDGAATAVGVTQMQGSSVIYSCTTAGAWFTNGIGTGYSGSFPTVSSTDGLTAHAGGTQAAALLLTTAINRVTTVASVADSIKLPASAPGMQITAINAATNSMQVYGSGTDTINAVATATGVAVPGGKTANFYCTLAGAWHMLLSA
jgi:hypothetical protein